MGRDNFCPYLDSSQKELTLLESINSAVVQSWRSTRTVTPVGSFEAYIDEECSVPWMSFAMPISSEYNAASVRRDVAGLREVFAGYNRILRFELLDSVWPGLTYLLRRAGLREEERQPLLACRPEDRTGTGRERTGRVRPAPVLDLVEIDKETTLDFLVEFVNVQRRAYGFSGGAVSAGEEALSLYRDVQRGRMSGLVAVSERAIVGTAVNVGLGPIKELAGVCTAPERRREGIAAALSAAAVDRHFASGGEVSWLTAGSPEAERIYRSLGFAPAGCDQVNLSDHLER